MRSRLNGMMQILQVRNLILINVITIVVFFLLGLIHPYAVLTFYIFLPFLGFLAVLLCIMSIAKLIVDYVRFKKSISLNLLMILLCCFLVVIFSYFQYISFFGLRTHYWFVKDYETVRRWAQKESIPEEGLLVMNGFDIPEPAKPFHPENVQITEKDNVRILGLSWDSGFMQVGWELVILPSDEVYQVQKKLTAKIRPGVYLHYEFYSH